MSATDKASTTRSDAVDEILRQWQHERPDLDATPMAVFGRIARVRHLAAKHLEQILDDHGLTLSAFDVLANLRRSGRPYRKTPSELAESSMLTSGGITFRLDRLETDGLVRRVPSSEDRRVVFAELTEKGREAIDRALEDHLEAEREMLQLVSAKKAKLLASALRDLENSIRTSDGRALPQD